MPVTISRVTIEHYALPVGIAEASPRLSWRFASPDAGADAARDWTQTAYEVTVAPVGGQMTHTKVDGAASVLVPWPAPPLAPRQGATVRVRAHGSDGTPTEWAEVYVEAGLDIARGDFTARVISGQAQAEDKPKRPFRLRSTFTVPAGKASGQGKRVRIYASALGMYELYLNGERVGDQLLAPGWQSYDHRLAYQTYDVGHLLREGENVLAAWVAEGWYAGRLGWFKKRNFWGTRPGLVAQLEVDGEAVLRTGAGEGEGEGEGEGWEWSYGALESSEIYDGEVHDLGADNDEWKKGKGGVGEWKKAEVLDTLKGTLYASQTPPIREVETFSVKEVITTPKGKTILDLGQNFAGYVRLLRAPPKGTKEIVLSHAEVLEHGELGTRPLRDCRPNDRLVFSNGDTSRAVGWTPTFTFHGFRYVQVDGWEGVSAADLEGVAIHSQMERTGHFECSHALINRLHKNVVYSTLSNTIAVPTDCPQRDERLGWTGDIQVFGPTLSYLFNGAGFLANWLADLALEQKAMGGDVPVVVPNILPGDKAGPQAIWSDITSIAPSDLHTAFADDKVLRGQWESACLWLDRGVLRDTETGLWDESEGQLADWLAPAAPPWAPAMAPTDNHLVANAYLVHTTRVAARIGRIIGGTAAEKAATYEADVERLTKAFYRAYVTPSGRTVSDTQTALALITYFDIYPGGNGDDNKKEVERLRKVFGERLALLVRKDFFRVSTGFAGTPIILMALAKAGHVQVAYRMLQEPTCPSFLSPVLLGATTIWERWDSMLQDGTINPGEMTSFNHYALGSVAHFMHTIIGGLSPLAPGWSRILIRPQPGGTLTHAKTSFVSGYGRASVSWEIKEGVFGVEVEVPPNTTARVELPSGTVEEVGSGTRRWEEKWEGGRGGEWPPKIVQPPFCRPIKDEFVA